MCQGMPRVYIYIYTVYILYIYKIGSARCARRTILFLIPSFLSFFLADGRLNLQTCTTIDRSIISNVEQVFAGEGIIMGSDDWGAMYVWHALGLAGFRFDTRSLSHLRVLSLLVLCVLGLKLLRLSSKPFTEVSLWDFLSTKNMLLKLACVELFFEVVWLLKLACVVYWSLLALSNCFT